MCTSSANVHISNDGSGFDSRRGSDGDDDGSGHSDVVGTAINACVKICFYQNFLFYDQTVEIWSALSKTIVKSVDVEVRGRQIGTLGEAMILKSPPPGPLVKTISYWHR